MQFLNHYYLNLKATTQSKSLFDWLFALVICIGGIWSLSKYGHAMDVYEQYITLCTIPCLVMLGWFWRPLQHLMFFTIAASSLGIFCYQDTTGTAQLARAETQFLLKYFLSSQSAIFWMSVLFFLSTIFYWLGVPDTQQSDTMEQIASKMAWSAVGMACVATMMRWFESYLIGADVGHIPVSNLYEVFILFCWLTTTFYLYFETHYKTRSLGAFVMLVVSAAVGFLLWYTLVRNAHEIQPLVPALKSWWMKLHVPANFIGYGMFSLAAMVAFAYLIKQQASVTMAQWYKLTPLWLLGVVLCFLPMVFRKNIPQIGANYWFGYVLVAGGISGMILWARQRIATKLPPVALLDDMMYKSIAVGFAFFTIATVLGAFWAADAWGGYWSWDPKETWALIVWLNYAAWLHMRLMKGLRGIVAAWWALAGLAVTSFAFLGVNMFLAGLHSYGTL